jgi:hypothetical protein
MANRINKPDKNQESKFRVINVDALIHEEFKIRCAQLRIPMAKRASRLLSLDNDKVIPDLSGAEETTKSIRELIELAQLAKELGLTPAYMVRLKSIAKRDSVRMGNLLLEHLLVLAKEEK